MARIPEITATIIDRGREWTLTVTSTNARAREVMLRKTTEAAIEIGARIIDGNSPFAFANAKAPEVEREPEIEPESEREPSLLTRTVRIPFRT